MTICTREREYFLGEIENDRNILKKTGMMVEKCWVDIPKHFIGTKLDEYMIMPNHIHGILIISGVVGNAGFKVGNADSKVGNADLRSLRKDNNLRLLKMLEYDRTKMYLSRIIHGFKSSVSRIVGRPIWQKSFYDRIIRNEIEYEKIREYIRMNPEMWERDRNNLRK